MTGIFRSLKLPLKRVLRNYDVVHPVLDETVLRLNEIATRSFQLLKLLLLDNPRTHVDRKLLTQIFGLVGSSKTCSNVELQRVYDSYFAPIYEKLDKKNLSGCLDTLQAEMIRCLETNVRTHFYKHVNRFVNETFDLKHNENVRKELAQVKRDLYLGGQAKSDPRYHEWIDANRAPNESRLEKYPQEYVPYLISLNKKLARPFNVVPQRKGFVPKMATF